MTAEEDQPTPAADASAPSEASAPAAARSDQRVDLDDPAVIEALVRYDDLDPAEVARFEADPSVRVLLGLLRRADRAFDDGDEFTSDELYTFGRGPGSRGDRDGACQLTTEREREIRRYLAARPELQHAVAALGTPPPSPLLDIAPVDQQVATIAESNTPKPTLRPVPAAADAPRTNWMTWSPLAAAALVAAMVLSGDGGNDRFESSLPSSPLLRSGAEAPLLFPRGRIAHSTNASSYCASPTFELAPRKGADAYRFKLVQRAENASAFAEGDVIWTTRTTMPLAVGPALEPGQYEWSAWQVVNGLDKPLGTKSFAVTLAPSAVEAAAAGVSGTTDTSAVRDDIRQLHSAAFVTDARHRARALPTSDERDAYLESPR